MKKEKFESLLDEFLDGLKEDKRDFVLNMEKLDYYKDRDMSFIEWVQTFLRWSEVTTDVAGEFYAGWDDDEQ